MAGTDALPASPLREVTSLFLRLGVTAFGGPAAHIALIERECVQRRRWITSDQFLDVLGVASLIPGPTSTELAMHVGRLRAGWPGFVAAGVAFIAPAALLVGALAALYVRTGHLPLTRALLTAVQPVVIVVILQAILPLGRSAVRSLPLAVLAAAAALAAIGGVPEIYVLLVAGAVAAASRLATVSAMVLGVTAAIVVAAEPAGGVTAPEVFGYFVRTGSMIFGSGYVLLPVLEGDLVDRLGWLTDRQLLDAVAAGQATPGPLFTTATFIGYVIGGAPMAAVATAGMFLPAFVFAAIGSATLERLRHARAARAFLDGVNAAAVALIATAVVTLGRVAFQEPVGIGIGVAAALAIFAARVNATIVLLAAAAAGAVWGLVRA